MVLPGTFSAGTSACLRCQLRKALAPIRTQSPSRASEQRCRTLTTSRHLAEEADGTLVKTKDGYRWKKTNEAGYIIGKPGKRQRVVSERLSRDSLSRPANVIVLRDVKQEQQLPSPRRRAIQSASLEEFKSQPFSTQEIESAVTGREIAPTEAEVNTSIDALRPQETILDKQSFVRLHRDLLSGYTYKQLWRYLVKSDSRLALDPNPNRQRQQELANSQWRPGESPLSKRHGFAAKPKGKETKVQVADHILRLVWHLTVQSEVQEVGEIEVKVQPWQSSMLFDLNVDNRPYYEHCIASKALTEACQVYDLRSDGVLRIVGRRHDAEEAARQFNKALLSATRSEADLKAFRPLLGSRSELKIEELVSLDDLRFISDLTKSVVILEGDTIAIYGNSEVNRRGARRMAIALLDLQSPASFDGTFADAEVDARKKSRGTGKVVDFVPARSLVGGLHRRYRALELVRFARHLQKQEVVDDDSRSSTPEQLAEALAKQLGSVPEPQHGPFKQHAKSYWREEARLSDWETQYCNILREVQSRPTAIANSNPKPSRKTRDSSSRQSQLATILQHHSTGIETLLSYFEPQELPRPLNPTATRSPLNSTAKEGRRTFDRRIPYLSIYFIPSTTKTQAPQLPRIQMKFRFSSSFGWRRKVQLTGISTSLDKQHLSVPLPEHAVDMRLNREVTMISRLDVAQQDQHICQFLERLEESVQSGEGALDVPSEIKFSLPGWLVRGKGIDQARSEKEVEISYSVERFEQVQSVIFRPDSNSLGAEIVDKELKASLGSLPDNFYLDYKEVEGGAIHGSQTSLLLRMRQDAFSLPTREVEAGEEAQSDVTSLESMNTDTADVTPGSRTPTEAVSEKEAGTAAVPGASIETPEATEDQVTASQSHTGTSSASSSPLQLATAALGIANLLTRASNGSLSRFARDREMPVRKFTIE
ncbi:hypothetical protein DOTSEDRAFT_76807 [Lecanosticta acicola]|uniref:Mitochondrial inner-membrane-bound regulator-domain-containing protein n=1 Tax=Lecanosticta acicola TaxID=111012 RepID=A0AAI8YWP6_9PEZI|nr:hypothetical protein DOTSEDRAFT_76807 [Lecanosticta acicola]